jgi:hypothetical protein
VGKVLVLGYYKWHCKKLNPPVYYYVNSVLNPVTDRTDRIDSISQGYNRNPGEGQIRIDGSTRSSQGIKGRNKEATKEYGTF